MRRIRAAALRLTIRARIALFGAGVVLLTVVLFGALVDVLFEHTLYAQQDQALQRRAEQVQDAGRLGLGVGRVPGLPRRIDTTRTQVPVDLRSSGDSFLQFLDPAGSSLFTTGEVDGRPPRLPSSVLSEARTAGHSLATITDAGLPLRVYVVALPAGVGSLSPGGVAPAFAVAGQPDASIASRVSQLRLYLFLGALLSLVAALAASWVVAGRALRPLDTMTETVEAIGSARDLRRRLPEAPAHDEVGRLTGAFNGMMGRLDDAYGRLQEALDSQRRFVADASHELRTPLTSIRSNLGLLRRRADISAGDRAEALRDMDAEAERMSRLVNDLLTLARADAGQGLELAPVDLAHIGEEVCRQARRTYPARRIDLGRKPLPAVNGDADSLRQLLWILIDNAARHTEEGGRIAVALRPDGDDAELVVSDDGTGISPADRERIFERFYRADHARPAGGAGLGLSIARWIVQQHGGRIEAGDNPAGRGALFTVRLPRAAGQGQGTATQVA